MNPLESKHIAPLYEALCELGEILPRLLESSASVRYDERGGVEIMSAAFDEKLDSRGLGLFTRLLDSGAEFRAGEARARESSVGESNGRESRDARESIQNELDSVLEPAPDSHSKAPRVLDLLALLALRLKGWRKGPFTLLSPTRRLHIDSEWQSQMKWNLLAPRFMECVREWHEMRQERGREQKTWQKLRIADVGCNNGFYMLAMHAMLQEYFQGQYAQELDSAPESKTPESKKLESKGSRTLESLDSGQNAPRHNHHEAIDYEITDYEILGFDPSGLFFCQFLLLSKLVQAPLGYELLGVQDLIAYTSQNQSPATNKAAKKFDMIFCLGVLYHRSDVFATLKSLAQSLHKGGVAFVDTLIFDPADVLPKSATPESLESKNRPESAESQKSAESIDSSPLHNALSELPLVLAPSGSYAKMSNVYFLPTLRALEGWCKRCGFGTMELLAIIPTTTKEQRKTRWIDSLSLESFLDPDDESRTIEGYPAPKRAYIMIRRA